MRLYHPTEGEILIDGVNIQSINLSQYYANISAIFQDFIKYPSMYMRMSLLGLQMKNQTG